MARSSGRRRLTARAEGASVAGRAITVAKALACATCACAHDTKCSALALAILVADPGARAASAEYAAGIEPTRIVPLALAGPFGAAAKYAPVVALAICVIAAVALAGHAAAEQTAPEWCIAVVVDTTLAIPGRAASENAATVAATLDVAFAVASTFHATPEPAAKALWAVIVDGTLGRPRHAAPEQTSSVGAAVRVSRAIAATHDASSEHAAGPVPTIPVIQALDGPLQAHAEAAGRRLALAVLVLNALTGASDTAAELTARSPAAVSIDLAILRTIGARSEHAALVRLTLLVSRTSESGSIRTRHRLTRPFSTVLSLAREARRELA